MAKTLDLVISDEQMTLLERDAEEKNLSIDEVFNLALSEYLDDLEDSDTSRPVAIDNLR